MMREVHVSHVCHTSYSPLQMAFDSYFLIQPQIFKIYHKQMDNICPCFLFLTLS